MSGEAAAQCNGIFPNGTVCGNISGANRPGYPIPNMVGPGGLNGNIQYNNNGSFGGLSVVDVPRGGTGQSSFTANLPIIGNGTSALALGTKSGNTNIFTTLSGAATANLCGVFDASGNFTSVACGRLASTNTWTGDNFFGSGRPWCDVRAQGAVGNGIANDWAAIQTCVNNLITNFGGGTVYFPPGNYCIGSSISVNTGSSANGDIKFIGSGTRYSVVQVCGNNISAFILNNQFINVEKLAIYGYGMLSTDAVFTGTFPTNAAVVLNSGCSFCILRDVIVNGGIQPIQISANNYTIDHVSAQYAYGEATLTTNPGRAALVFVINAGGWISKSWFDQVHPVVDVAFPLTVSAWAPSVACSNGQVVTTQNFKIQYQGAGTTGGSAPTLRPYGNAITDGSCTAFLVGPNIYYSIQIDSGSNENYISQTDMTGTFEHGLGITNTFGTTAPIATHVSQSTPGGNYGSGIYLSAGTGVVINNSEVSGCLKTGCAGVNVQSTFSGNLTITSNRFFNSMNSGILVAGGNDIVIADNNIKSASTGINYTPASSGVYRFQLNSNNVSGMTTGITVSSNVAAGSFYTILGNICAGSAFTDSGAGTKYSPAGGNCI